MKQPSRKRRRTRKPPDASLPHTMYRSSRTLTAIRLWGGGLSLCEDDTLRHPEPNGEGVFIRSERKKRKRGKRGD